MQKNSFGAQQCKRRKRTTNRTASSIALLCALLGICSMPSRADETTPPAAPAAAATAPTPPTLFPAFSGSLAANSKPSSFDAGPLGNVLVTGIVSGFAQVQDHIAPNDHSTQGDLSNG